MFFIFVKVCKKYRFSYVLSTYGGLSLMLRPMDTFDNIKLEEKYIDYYKIFLKAIIKMKEYRNKK